MYNNKRFIKVILFSILFLVVLSLSIFGCSKIFGRIKGEVICAVPQLPNGLNPILEQNKEAIYLSECIFDGLMNHTGYTNNPYEVGLLAKEVEQDPINKNIYIGNLRTNVFWHDGRQFDAQDVKFTFDCIVNINNQSPLRTRLTKFIESISVINQSTIKITFRRPVPSFVADVILSSFKIIPRSYNGMDMTTDLRSEIGRQFINAPVGTGPFKFSKWKQGEMITLVANPTYYRVPPKLKKITMKEVVDVDKRHLWLNKKKVNMICDANPEYFTVLDAEGNKFNDYAPYYFYTIAFNTKNPKLNDPTIRRALAGAVDKKRLLKTIWQPGGNFTNSGPIPWNASLFVPPFGTTSPFEDLTPYNPSSSANILRGKSLSLTLLISDAGGESHKKIAEEYKKMLSEVGVSVDVVQVGANIFNMQVFQKHDYESALVVWDKGYNHLYDISNMYYDNSPDNIANVSVGNELITRWDEAVVLQEKLKWSQELHQICHELSPYIYLFTPPKRCYFAPNLQNVTIDSEMFFSSVEYWQTM